MHPPLTSLSPKVPGVSKHHWPPRAHQLLKSHRLTPLLNCYFVLFLLALSLKLLCLHCIRALVAQLREQIISVQLAAAVSTFEFTNELASVRDEASCHLFGREHHLHTAHASRIIHPVSVSYTHLTLPTKRIV
eukprot:TRINITY_DN52414_c0_g1_i1.p1 TRINITY_DN52414_c0_g1~~TRINITY_DN52414_c0_g1_i1.p1  ORF type:complete len:133 (-),score=4.92 TRINITY_DN52414_c0_g1_i1:96-494(-)